VPIVPASPHKARRRVWLVLGLGVLGGAALLLASDLRFFGVDARAALRGTPIAFHDETPAEPFDIQVEWHGRALTFRGSFQRGAADALRHALDANPHVRVLRLAGPGGWVGEAVRAGHLLRTRGIETEAVGDCFSACSIVFAGGVKRRLASGAQLGFHTANFNGLNEEVVQRLQTRMRDAYAAAGVTDAFLDEIMRTPFERMWIPDRPDLRAGRMITD
jgi:hypothetical protein